MASSTTIKVASQTGAAKDDSFTSSSTGLSEDMLVTNLNVLANDPGAARLYSLEQYPTGTQMPIAMSGLTTMGATITINSDGTVKYDASALRDKLQGMGGDETVVDTFTYTVRMANGALSTATVKVQLGGVNDCPTLGAVEGCTLWDTAADDHPAPITGNLSGSDIDHGDVVHYALAGGAPTANPHEVSLTNDYGTLTLDTQSGAYSFVANAAALNGLKAGDSMPLSFKVTAVDSHNAASNQRSIDITLHGAADAAEIAGTASGAVAEDGTLTTGGTLSVADRDAGESSFVAPDSTALKGQYGSFTFDKDSGEWTYTLDNEAANVQALADGEPVSDKLTVSSIDGTTKDIVVNITGTNDRPTLSAVDAVEVKDTAGDDQPDAVEGTLAGSDIDNGDVVHYALVDGSAPDDDGMVVQSHAYGTLTFNTKSGEYSFAVDAAKLNALPDGEAVEISFDVIAIDSHDASSNARAIVITLTGADDPSGITGTFTGNVSEDGEDEATGTVAGVDRDAGQAALLVDASTLQGSYGHFTFDATSGEWTYTLDNDSDAVQQLGEDEEVSDTLDVTTVGGAKQQISVTITGTNDRPTLSAVAAVTVNDTAAADAPDPVTGTLSGSDIDNGDVVHYALDGGEATANPHEVSLTNDYGTLTLDTETGAYSFAIEAAALNGLKAGDSVPLSFKVTAVDSQDAASDEGSIDITLQGAADAAEIAGTASGAVAEDGTLTTGGTLSVADRDAGESSFVAPDSTALKGQYGSFTFDKDSGDWTYALHNSAANVQALAGDEPATDKLTVSSIDGTTQDIVVNITGANDKPTLDAVGQSFVFDHAVDDTPAALSGSLSGHDVDHGAVLSYAFSSGGTAVPGTDLVTQSSEYGTLTLNTKTGAYSFQMDATKADVLKAGQQADSSFSVVAVDEHGAKSDSQALLFTLVGTNDPADITGTFTGTVREDTTLSTGGQLFVSDRDAGEAGFQAVTSGLAGTYGSFSFNKDTGVWSYALNNSATNVQALNSTDTRTDQLTVKSLDGTEGLLTVTIQGLDEATLNLSASFTVNRGNAINKTLVINNFDSNDKLDLVNQMNYISSSLTDYIKTDSNPLDSTQVTVSDNGDIGTVILVGYTTFNSATQII